MIIAHGSSDDDAGMIDESETVARDDQMTQFVRDDENATLTHSVQRHRRIPIGSATPPTDAA